MDKAANILVVEDDFAISLAIKTILQNNVNCQLTLCYNGQEAIDSLEKITYDLVLSDWNMPVKTGQELLEYIRGNEKEQLKTLPFIMLTARADRDSVIDAAKLGVTDFIHKPFNREQLITKIKQALSMPGDQHGENDTGKNTQPTQATDAKTQDKTIEKQSSNRRTIVDIIVEKLRNDDFKIPVSSDITINAIECLNNPDVTSLDIANIIKKDAILSTRIISIANSSLFRGSRDSNTLEEAITRLGLKETNNYLWLLANTALFDSSYDLFKSILSRAKLHSLATAECAQIIAKSLRLDNPTEYYYMGLLHDVGTVLIIQILEDIETEQSCNNYDGIYDLLDKLHHDFGAKLLKRWKMPEKTVNIAMHHDNPEACKDCQTELNVINLANHISHYFNYTVDENKTSDSIATKSNNLSDLLALPSAKTLGITAELLSMIEVKLPENMLILTDLI